jgi:hypothetical protein
MSRGCTWPRTEVVDRGAVVVAAEAEPPVELACGSTSTSRVGRPSSASAAARLMAVVVLPTPPFWLTMAMILVREAEVSRRGGFVRFGHGDGSSA